MLNAFVTNEGYRVEKDISYGSENRHTLDIYIPDKLSSPASVVVFFYGGSWQTGEKNEYKFVGQAFASKGHIVVIADYRLYPQVKFPAFLKDAAFVLKWTHSRIAHYGGDPKKLFLAGHSAGAYNAVMLGLNTPYTRSITADIAIKGIIGIAGPYDFLPMTDPKIIEIFSDESAEKTQPITWVQSGLPPMFLATGEADEDVGPRNTQNFSTRLRATGNEAKTILYPELGHIGIILSLAEGFRNKAPLLKDVDEFITHINAKKGKSYANVI